MSVIWNDFLEWWWSRFDAKHAVPHPNKSSPSKDTTNEDHGVWRKVIFDWYPHIHRATYCVPPIYFKRVPYSRHSIAAELPVLVTCEETSKYSTPSLSGEDLKKQAIHAKQELPFPPESMWTPDQKPGAKPKPVLDCDVRDDMAQQHVLHCLQELGEQQNETMFVLSQLKFANYLNKIDATVFNLPRPADLPGHLDRCDFDILVVHRTYGILVGEVKSVGFNDKAKSDKDVTKRVQRAVKQLEKSERVMKHVVSDIAPGITVRKTVILPYVSSDQLCRVVESDTRLAKDFCQSIGSATVPEAVQMCLCSNQLSDRHQPHLVDSSTMEELSGWFHRRMAKERDPSMTPDVYVDIISRIVGPATSVEVHCPVPPRLEVRTLSDAISEIGNRLCRLVLIPEQLELLNQATYLNRVCIVGPPGTGKTVVLVLVGLQWLREGHNVLVLSTDHNSLAISHLICHQLEKTLLGDTYLPIHTGRVQLLTYDLYKEETSVDCVVEDVVKRATNQSLHILMDEADFSFKPVSTRLRKVIRLLLHRIPSLCLWASSMECHDVPDELQKKLFRTPLRSSPAVLREVEPGIDMFKDNFEAYSSKGTHVPSDGPNIIQLRHEGEHHTGRWPVDCEQCGRMVAQVLKKLKIGSNDTSSAAPSFRTPPPLEYHDVFVLTRSCDLTDASGEGSSLASAFVTGMRDEEIPVTVSCYQSDRYANKEMIRKIAVGETKSVIVAYVGDVVGLERKVVVHLPGRIKGTDDERNDKQVEAIDRIIGMSRCTGQLVLVQVPDKQDQTQL